MGNAHDRRFVRQTCHRVSYPVWMLNFARKLRQSLTPAERILWSRLRCRQISGYKSRRQHMIGSYICDFACVEERIAIELDASGHLDDASCDEGRDRFLRSQGWRILRFWNGDVLNRTDSIVETIAAALECKTMDGRFD